MASQQCVQGPQSAAGGPLFNCGRLIMAASGGSRVYPITSIKSKGIWRHVMLGKGIDVFLQFSHESEQRILHKGLALSLEGGMLQVRVEEEPDLPLAAGQDMLI